MYVWLEFFYCFSHCSAACVHAAYAAFWVNMRYHYFFLGFLHIIEVPVEVIEYVIFWRNVWSYVRSSAAKESDIIKNKRIFLQVLYLVFFSQEFRSRRAVMVARDKDNLPLFLKEWPYHALALNVKECYVPADHYHVCLGCFFGKPFGSLCVAVHVGSCKYFHFSHRQKSLFRNLLRLPVLCYPVILDCFIYETPVNVLHERLY